MKKILLLTIITLLFSCSTTKQVTTTKNKNGNLIGICNKESFMQEPYNEWFNDGYKYYKTDKEVIEKLKPLLKGIKIKAFLGTWCGDSRREIPVFYKILDEANFNYKNLTTISLNRAKKANGLEKNKNIIHVPTFIFYKNDKEIGRFVEYSVYDYQPEKDFLQILSGKQYKHAYEN